MAIVINGSGTVTGLAVGGLPDGTVDAGTLATNSVDSAELIDGAVDDSHMAAMAASKLSGTVATARLPAGTVLQVVTGTPRSSDSTTTTSGSWVNAGVSVVITPSSTSSKILVLQTLIGGSSNSGAYTNALYTLQRSIGTGAYSIVTPYTSTDGGGNVYGGLTNGSYGGATELYTSPSLNHLDSPSTTSECTYLVYFRGLGGYGTAHIKKGSTIMALEIAG